MRDLEGQIHRAVGRGEHSESMVENVIVQDDGTLGLEGA